MTNETRKTILEALRLSSLYLGKAIADGLMQDCVIPPQNALPIVEKARELLEEDTQKEQDKEYDREFNPARYTGG